MRCLFSLLCLFTALSLALPANAQVIGRSMDPKANNGNAAVQSSMLEAITKLTLQNRGNDALATLTNAVDSGIFLSDHHSFAPPATNALDLLTSGKALTAPQILQIVNQLCNAHRGDEAVKVYTQALSQGVIRATP